MKTVLQYLVILDQNKLECLLLIVTITIFSFALPLWIWLGDYQQSEDQIAFVVLSYACQTKLECFSLFYFDHFICYNVELTKGQAISTLQTSYKHSSLSMEIVNYSQKCFLDCADVLSVALSLLYFKAVCVLNKNAGLRFAKLIMKFLRSFFQIFYR